MIYPTAAQLKEPIYGRTPAVRLMARYTVESDGCWRWARATTTSGYGHFSIRSRYFQAHRLTYILLVGPIPDGLELDHLCRNRACVNPEHLQLVTRAVNVQRGSAARLTASQVADIRRAHANGTGVRELARQHGVNPATVSRIVNGLHWRDLHADIEHKAA